VLRKEFAVPSCGRHVTSEMLSLFKYPDVQTKSHVTPAYLVHRLSTETPPYITGFDEGYYINAPRVIKIVAYTVGIFRCILILKIF
jgi:hypothetical protein